MFAHIRKHQKWLLILIIGIVTVSFVIFFTPNVSYDNLGSIGRKAVVGYIDGQPITQTEFNDSARDAMLYYYIRTGRWPGSGNNQFAPDIDREAQNRLLLQRKAEDYGIKVSDQAAAGWVVNVFTREDTNQVSQFQSEQYDFFVANVLPQRGLSEADLHEFARNQIAIIQLSRMVGLPGNLVTPGEARYSYRNQNRQAETQALYFSKSDYVNLGLSLDDLPTFYTNRMALYRKLPQRQLHYLRFASTNYLAEAETQLTERTNLAELVDQIYQAKGTNDLDSELDEAGVALAKEEIRQQELEKEGWAIAKSKAREFAVELFEKEPNQAENLLEMAAAQGLAIEQTEPFTQGDTIPELGLDPRLTQQIVRQAFQLTDDEPFLQPLETKDAVVLLALDTIIPSFIPPLDEIRGQVTSDFYEQQSLDSARQAADEFHATLTNRLAQGSTFEEICQTHHFTPVEMPLFSLATETLENADPRSNLQTLKNLAFDMSAGEVSEPSSTFDGAMILYLKAFQEVSEEQIEEELDEYTATLRDARQSDAYFSWIQQEQTLVNFPTYSEEQAAN